MKLLLHRFFGRASTTADFASAILICMLMAGIFSDVVMRYIFSSPIMGITEICESILIALVFIQLPNTHIAGRLPRSDALLIALRNNNSKKATVLQILSSATGAFILAVIAYKAFPQLISAYQNGDFRGTPGIVTVPQWPVYLCVLLGSAWLTGLFVVETLKYTAQLFQPAQPSEEK